MKKGKSIAIAILLIIAIYLYNIYLAAKSLSFALGRIQNVKISFGTLSFILNLRVTNGEGVSIPITGLNVDNYFGKSILGKAILQESIFISGNSVSDVPLLVNIPLTDLLYLIPEIKSVVSTKTISFSLKGNVSVVGISVPVNQKYVLNLNNIL